MPSRMRRASASSSRVSVLSAITRERVVVQACRGFTCSQQSAQPLGGAAQQAVHAGVAVALLQRAQVLDLDQQRAFGLLQALQHRTTRGQPGLRVIRAAARALLGALRACTLDPVLNRRYQVPRAHRLAQEIIRAAVQNFVMDVRVGISGQEHDRGVRVPGILAQGRGQHRAAGVGQVQVHQDQVGLEIDQRGQHVSCIRNPVGAHAGAMQHGFGEQRLAAVVLHDQDAIGLCVRRGRGHLGLVPCRAGLARLFWLFRGSSHQTLPPRSSPLCRASDGLPDAERAQAPAAAYTFARPVADAVRGGTACATATRRTRRRARSHPPRPAVPATDG